LITWLYKIVFVTRKTTQLTRAATILSLILSLTLLLPGQVRTEQIAVGSFTSVGLQGWEPKSFKGFTEYNLVQENGKTVVKAVSTATASGLVKKISFDPKKYRYLSWSWKIDHTVAGEDERTKAGDDYAARIYVIFAGRYFWQTKAINYVWANQLKKGEYIANPFSTNVMMVPVQSGQENTGQWFTEERDILADYRKLFGSDPHEASAIAIMTDTDNTGTKATAWYGDIIMSTLP